MNEKTDPLFAKLKSKLNPELAVNFEDTTPEGAETFIWVGTKDKEIGDEECHYEICADGKKPHAPGRVYVELHCERINYKRFRPLANGEFNKQVQFYGIFS